MVEKKNNNNSEVWMMRVEEETQKLADEGNDLCAVSNQTLSAINGWTDARFAWLQIKTLFLLNLRRITVVS